MTNNRKYVYRRGLREGFYEGIKQGKKICANKMLKKNISMSLIKKITKLTKEEILKDYNKD